MNKNFLRHPNRILPELADETKNKVETRSVLSDILVAAALLCKLVEAGYLRMRGRTDVVSLSFCALGYNAAVLWLLGTITRGNFFTDMRQKYS